MEIYTAIFLLIYLLTVVIIGVEYTKRDIQESLVTFTLILLPIVNSITAIYFLFRAFKTYDWNKFK